MPTTDSQPKSTPISHLTLGGFLVGWSAAVIAWPRELADLLEHIKSNLDSGNISAMLGQLQNAFESIDSTLRSGDYHFVEGILLRAGPPYMLTGGVPGAVVGGLVGTIMKYGKGVLEYIKPK